MAIEENLIEAVRHHKVLFDTSHADYMKAKLKNKIWEKIAEELKLKNGKYNLFIIIIFIKILFIYLNLLFKYYMI